MVCQPAKEVEWREFLDSVLLCMVGSVYNTIWKYVISFAKEITSKDKEKESGQKMD